MECQHCGTKRRKALNGWRWRCYLHCQKANDGKHVPNPRSIARIDDAPEWVVDVNCALCGQSGGVSVDPSAVEWE